MRHLIFAYLFWWIIFVFSKCKSDSKYSSTFNSVDTVSLDGNNSENNNEAVESSNLIIDEYGESSSVPGNAIPFESAENLLSTMLYHSLSFQDNSGNASTIKIKLLKSKYLEVHDYNKSELKHSIINCGNYTDGFGGLEQSLQMAYELNSTKSPKEVLVELSGLSYTRTTNHSQAFSYINPELANWCWINFYRTPTSDCFANVSLNTIYDIIFKKFVRTLVIAHIELEGNNIENEINWYRNSIIMEKGYAPELLSKRYVLPEQYSRDEINANYFPHAAGFWLRRSIDESDSLLWNYLRIIIMDYDYNWACENFKICDRG